MIKFEMTEVMNFENAIRGMRNPLNSWDKMDSTRYEIGPNDLNLMKRLINAGTDHRKFLRQIFVSVDVCGPLYWWKEADTYGVGVVKNSCSTMHKIHAKEFTLDDFSHEHLDAEEIDILNAVIDALNWNRDKFIETKDKKYWWHMIQLLPSSYNQKRTVTLNYEVLRNIATSRKHHKLDEWSIGFMEWIKSLPYAEELILSEGND